MSDNWAEVLKQIEPDYDNLKEIMDNGPKVVARMRTFNNRWRVRIEEEWELDSNPGYGKLDKRCDWAAEQLANWKFVGRLSYQEWVFLNRAQAEKFLTLYNLKWAQ
jgi:hypothetical protein